MTLLRLYQECLVNTLKGVRAHPWALLLPIVYGVILVVAGMLVGPMGQVGGFVMGLLTTALCSSALYFIHELVFGHKVTVNEFQKSLGHFFWSVMAVRFVLWIVDLLVGPMLQGMPNGNALALVLDFALFILLNATPEVIYQRGTTTGLQPILESIEFVQTHWIEWFIPNIAFGAALYFGFPFINALLVDLGVPYVGSTSMFVIPLFIFPVMLFRGHLFKLLTTFSPRALEMRYRGK